MGLSNKALSKLISQQLEDAGLTSAAAAQRPGSGRLVRGTSGAHFWRPNVRGHRCVPDDSAVLIRFIGRVQDEEYMLLRYLAVLDNLGYPAERQGDPNNEGRLLIRVTN